MASQKGLAFGTARAGFIPVLAGSVGTPLLLAFVGADFAGLTVEQALVAAAVLSVRVTGFIFAKTSHPTIPALTVARLLWQCA